MAAVLSPPHLHPGLVRLPGVGDRRPGARSRSRLRPVGAPLRPQVAVSPAVTPTGATYRRRRAVALLLLVAVSLFVQVAVSATAGRVLGSSAHVATVDADAVAASGAGAPLPTAVASAPAVAPTSVYVVRSGDSLWSIAHRLKPDADPRPLVDALAERAGSSALRPGQRIDLDGLAL